MPKPTKFFKSMMSSGAGPSDSVAKEIVSKKGLKFNKGKKGKK